MTRFILFLAFLIPGLDWAGGMALNPAVNQSTIGQTICSPSWVHHVRPPTSFTNPIKRAMIRMEGYEPDAVTMESYELDHIIPLSLGGAPRSRDNLQLQPWEGPDGARAKDVVETFLHREVCAHRVSLANAQRCIFNHWQQCRKGNVK